MASTNFVRWASSPGAQLMSDDKYKAAASTGLVPGIADLEQANKSWLQASAIAEAFGHLVTTNKAAYDGVDFLDTDTAEQLAEKVFAVFAKRLPGEIPNKSIVTSKLADESVTIEKLAKKLDFGSSEIQIRGMPLSQLKLVTLKDRELALATDTFQLFAGDGKSQGGILIGGDTATQIVEIREILEALTNSVAKLGSQSQPFTE